MPFSCVTFPWRTSTSASLSAKFRHTIPNTIQMYVYRCTLYTTLQNAGWTRKAGYSLSAVSAHFLRACGHYLRMISSLQENESRVLPGMRKKGVAPRSRYMCAYIHLVRTCCPRSARLSTVDWLSSTVARADAFFELVDTTFVWFLA